MEGLKREMEFFLYTLFDSITCYNEPHVLFKIKRIIRNVKMTK